MVLVTGREHLLSQQICDVLGNGYDTWHMSFDSLRRNYVSDIEKTVHNEKPEAIINCFEYSDIEGAEYNDETAYAYNAFFARDLAGICKRNGIYLMHCSSSGVFSGGRGSAYTEDDDMSPLSVYGDSKRLGERYIRESGVSCCIIRFGNVYGGSPLLAYWPHVRVEQDRILAVKDHCVSPISTVDAASALRCLLKMKAGGTYHVCHEGPAGTGDFVRTALDMLSGYADTHVRGVYDKDGQDFQSAVDVDYYSVLDPSRYRDYTGNAVSTWQKGLEEYIAANHHLIGALV